MSVLRCNIGNTISDDGKFAVKDDPIEDCPAILCRNGSNSIGSGANQTGNHDGYWRMLKVHSIVECSLNKIF